MIHTEGIVILVLLLAMLVSGFAITKPPQLAPGATVGFISPASPPSQFNGVSNITLFQVSDVPNDSTFTYII